MINLIVPIAAIAALFLIGCGETPKGTTNDVAEANKQADKSITGADANEAVTKANESMADAVPTYARPDAEAQVKPGSAQANAMSERAQAQFDLAITTAQENYKAATQKCDALGGTVQITCKSAAEAILATANADASTKRDAALLAAE